MIAICMLCEASQSRRPAGCAGPCLCTDTGRDIKVQVAEGACPRGLFAKSAVALPQAAASPLPPRAVEEIPGESPDDAPPWGPAMWAELHTAKEMDEARLMSWSRRVPCGPCATGWTTILREMPPVYGDGWFEWTWRAHNAVNAKLGKPEITLEQARATWAVE